ncbi:iron ABC transporter permease [Brevibacillus laterosporus]|uniref:FecCD family ABC transporter permease n=1 Tax=Brevibacillus laterosporus TaxID=1465 RepID=UPI00036CD417|nr:iron ABC transporter permease [Brevibacillus laterosporus]ATO49655.1 iron ABC transporter permease [Brevibacillus laterosporus DSM 25]MBG9801062.1 iron ABC transporter permease [Brevibacillus laterosporus]MED2003246.1 iron ABC transporter permease [Brevibacillus laterosporus]MED4765324.1 iron ABC transporter permease [Brevibacillus laterosporus]TPH11007.1 iron ABC transporter permease [Brevibacillus laterosporus]
MALNKKQSHAFAKTSTTRFWTVIVASICLGLLATYISVTNGEFDMTIKDVINTLLRIDPNPEHDLVIFDFRLPRIVIAALVGMGLGMAGTVVQAITRNGLADPGILGINAGAGSAIVLFIFLFEGKMGNEGLLTTLAMPMFGLMGGLLSALLIYLFAWQKGKLDPQRLILVGIAVGTGLGAFTLYLSLRMNAKDFEMATVWMTGSIWSANWIYIVAMLPWFILFIPVLFRKANILNLLQLDESSVRGLGVSTEKEKMVLLLASIGIISACVSVSGSIGFVGLMAPHIAKALVGNHHARVLPVSALMGMLLVLVSDFIAKTVFSPAELPVGIVIAIIGGPYFLYLLYKARA